MFKSFLLGLVTGAATVWIFGDSVADAVDGRTRSVRATLARRLRSTADAFDRGISGEPRAEAPTKVEAASCP